MNAILEDNKEQINALCRKYGVARLEVFGSANTPEFDPEASDFDFVVEFEDYGPGIADRYLGFANTLEATLRRKVDLVFERRMKPRFRAFIAPQREVIFEAPNDSIAA
jgi:predicted nucleotidyltransferase